jgi:hypothetical protein
MTDATKMRAGDRWHAFPMAAGNDGSFVYTALVDGRQVVRLADADGERDLVTASGHGQLVDDTLLYVRGGVLLAQRLTPETRQLSGRAIPIALEVGPAEPLGRAYFTASPRVVITAPASLRWHQLRWFPFTEGQDTPIREPGDSWQIRLSPDDRFAALTQTTPLLRTLDVAIVPMSQSGFTKQLSRAVAADSDPVWSPDGRRMVFRSLQDGPPRLYTQAAHVEGAEDEIVPMSTADETPTDWRGDRIIVHAPGAQGDFDLQTVDERTGAREVVANTPFNETDGRLSPDGRWLAYVSDESGEPDIYAAPWPRGGRVRISFAGGTRPRWSRDGRGVFFLRGAEIMRADLDGSTFTTPRAMFKIGSIRDFDVAHQRDAILALVSVPQSERPPATVIVDWRSLVQ